MKKRKTLFDDGYAQYITEGCSFDGKDGIPRLANFGNAEIPLKLVPFDKVKTNKDYRGYVHFYLHDSRYGDILKNPKKYDSILGKFDGIVTPDPTIIIGRSRCLHVMATYYNRAIGCYEQRRGLPVVPNVRWGDPSTYEFCFLGIPKHSIVAISTHGAIARDVKTGSLLRRYFKMGLDEMLVQLEPSDVLVYGFMPSDIFGDCITKTRFHRFPSEFERTHGKVVK